MIFFRLRCSIPGDLIYILLHIFGYIPTFPRAARLVTLATIRHVETDTLSLIELFFVYHKDCRDTVR